MIFIELEAENRFVCDCGRPMSKVKFDKGEMNQLSWEIWNNIPIWGSWRYVIQVTYHTCERKRVSLLFIDGTYLCITVLQSVKYQLKILEA